MAKILIVEDDPLMLRMYQKIFTLEQYAVEIATNGEEALEKVRTETEKPIIILMDIMMPKMNGLEALDKLKANPDTQKIPVVMLTNLAGQQDAEEALLKGAVKYIIKSEYEPKQVVDMVKEVLAGYTRDAVPQAAAPTQPAMPEQAPTQPAAPAAISEPTLPQMPVTAPTATPTTEPQ
jgi:two-component system, OmpR family, alkaline phosphatase synthesis response regulator PhoP